MRGIRGGKYNNDIFSQIDDGSRSTYTHTHNLSRRLLMPAELELIVTVKEVVRNRRVITDLDLVRPYHRPKILGALEKLDAFHAPVIFAERLVVLVWS